jgi:hypothetical protein
MVAAQFNRAQQKADHSYVWMSATCALLAFGSFAPTYWLQLRAGTFVGPWLLHLHGALFFGWTLFLLSQATLAATGRLDHHRAWGLAGIALASAMVIIGLAAAINTLTLQLAGGYGDAARAFFVLPVSQISLFALFVVAAIVSILRRHPEAHKRFMLLATLSLLQAAVGRVFYAIAVGSGPSLRPGLGPPLSPLVALPPGLVIELMIAGAMVYDWRTRGRPHRAWWIGAAVMAAAILLRAPLSTTTAWRAFADAMARMSE